MRNSLNTALRLGLVFLSERLHLWLAAALHTSMMAFFQIFWAWTASWSSPHVDLMEREREEAETERVVKSRVSRNGKQKQ